MEEKHGIFNIKGQEIHYAEAGQQGRQVALLIHGWSSSRYATSPLLGLLAQRFHCIAIDLPGYGDSPPLKERATIPRYAELLADLLVQISTRPVVLVGHSMGGMISMMLALNNPILVERMVLLNPTVSGRLSGMINLLISPITLLERFGFGRFIVSSIENMFVGLTDRLMKPVSFAARSDINGEAYAHIRKDARKKGQGRVRAECFQAMLDNDMSERIKDLQPPALVIWGAEDNTVPLRDAGIVADEWPTADLRIFPKAGHWPHFETPETTRRQVAAYLGLPLHSSDLYMPVKDEELMLINEVARFLTHSDIGNNLNEAQRIRLAAQCKIRHFDKGDVIAHAKEKSQELFIIQKGHVEVWKDPDDVDEHVHRSQLQHVADLYEGQITGELAMLDEGERSADLVAGEEGVTLLVLSRERIITLFDDDAELGARFLWNMARAMSRRVRYVLLQLNWAQEGQLAATSDPFA